MLHHPTQHERKGAALALIAVYMVGRMAGEPFIWRHLSPYFAYGFELVLVVCSLFMFPRPTLWRQPRPLVWLVILGAFVAGFSVLKAALPLGLVIPFDVTSLETAFLLVILAPLLEEAIFRVALWDALRQFTRKGRWLVSATTLLFIWGHLSVYWLVPMELQGFVLYQSAYVLVLGAVAGWARHLTGTFAAPVLIHFAFNLGFYLSAVRLPW